MLNFNSNAVNHPTAATAPPRTNLPKASGSQQVLPHGSKADYHESSSQNSESEDRTGKRGIKTIV